MLSHPRSFIVPAALVLFLSALEGQEIELTVEAEAPLVRSCDELPVHVRLRTSGAPIGGYQLFVRFPADRFEAIRFEPGAVSASVFTAGPAPFGGGAGDCGETADPWDDGQGEDVVAIAASVVGETSQLPLEGEALAGTIVFRPIVAASAAVDAAFALDPADCGGPFDRVTRVYSTSGAALDASVSGSFGVEIVDASAVVADLACELAGDGAARLSWSLPAAEISALDVFRDGERIATLPSDATEHVDDIAGLVGRVSYEVAAVLEGVEPCERASCELLVEVAFRRGDVDGSGRLNISDGSLVLQHLFRSMEIDCRDAADANDDGSLNLTDGVYLLNYLFRSAQAPPAPFPDPGVDPTPDDLDCESYGRA